MNTGRVPAHTICARCGSREVEWLGETNASIFLRCARCEDIWRLDKVPESERQVDEPPLRSAAHHHAPLR